MGENVKHTPGPWSVGYENTGGGYTVMSGPLRVAHTSIQALACRPDGRPIFEEEAKANGYLVAAAPEMLDALRAAERELYQVPPDDPEQERVLTTVRAAIAKAEGRP